MNAKSGSSIPAERGSHELLANAFERNPVFAHVHAYELYRNWLEAVWCFLNAAVDPQAYKACLDRYSPAQGAEYARLLALYIEAVEATPFRDVLGELFMRLDVNSARSGQYFTPWSIAEMMARMQFDRHVFEQTAAEKGVVSVCDPAVGSGVMLLAFAKVVHDELGRRGTNKLRLYGTDIDLRCVHMCRIQLRMNGLDGFGRMAGMTAMTATLEQDKKHATLAVDPGPQLELPMLLPGKVA